MCHLTARSFGTDLWHALRQDGAQCPGGLAYGLGRFQQEMVTTVEGNGEEWPGWLKERLPDLQALWIEGKSVQAVSGLITGRPSSCAMSQKSASAHTKASSGFRWRKSRAAASWSASRVRRFRLSPVAERSRAAWSR